MTTPHQIDLRCPVCERRSLPPTVVWTNSSGAEHTDVHEGAAEAQSLPRMAHTCDRCGHAFAERDSGDEAGAGDSQNEPTEIERALMPSSESPALDLRRPAWGRGRVSHVTYMRVQAALMPRGAELAWIEQNSAAYRAWVESFARISDDGPPTISEATLRRLARKNFANSRSFFEQGAVI